jgi:hypothetical protein
MEGRVASYAVRTFVNVTMYPQYYNNKNKFKKLTSRQGVLPDRKSIIL